MTAFQPLREIHLSEYGPGDVLVIFGEVFSRGYVNGLIDAAKRRGMTILYSTVGRRTSDGELRPLTKDELSQKEQPLINIPLEAGFDLEQPPSQRSPVDQLEGVRLSEWLDAKLDFEAVENARAQGARRFRQHVEQYIQQLQKHIPPTSHVLIAHTMAGGVPRAKIVMPAMNRVFKGHGDRYTSSLDFWNSDIGRLCAMSFMDVTAHTYQHLIDLSSPLRERQKDNGRSVSYVAYGYHGTAILMNGEYRWQSYSPYLQGFAKLELETIAKKAFKDGLAVSVYNAPEILTNSSSIFLGVEVALYPLLGALQKEGKDHPSTKHLLEQCQKLLVPGCTVDHILKIASDYFTSPLIAGQWSHYQQWPQHNGPEQMAAMREASTKIIKSHKDDKQLLTSILSEVVFHSCGQAMLNMAQNPKRPVWWIGHDLVAKLHHS